MKGFRLLDISYNEHTDTVSLEMEMTSYEEFKRLFNPSIRHQLDFMFDELIYYCRVYIHGNNVELCLSVEDDDEPNEYIANLTKDEKAQLLSIVTMEKTL